MLECSDDGGCVASSAWAQNLRQLAVGGLVEGFDYNGSKDVSFCEPCIEGKHHRSPLLSSTRELAKEPLELVHNDVCGKVNAKSFGGAQYFVTRYTWVYLLKRKDGKLLLRMVVVKG